ncbi:MAG: RNA polymerase sigma factor [Candidatus Doudnabacteria bacterium]|nr:RNA polymerase sigma factor [Candidatus Doudnabacteria bacterium]
MPENTDEKIAEDVQAGKTQAFGELVTRYEKKLSRYAKKFLFDHLESEDLVQEIFLKAFLNIQSFDTKRSFNSWVYRIAHNLFINEIKKKGKEPLPFFDPDTLFPHPTEPKKADDAIKEEELQKMMNACLSKLSPKYREVMILFYAEELSYEQISDILRIPASTVGVRLSRAKKALKENYDKLYQGK